MGIFHLFYKYRLWDRQHCRDNLIAHLLLPLDPYIDNFQQSPASILSPTFSHSYILDDWLSYRKSFVNDPEDCVLASWLSLLVELSA